MPDQEQAAYAKLSYSLRMDWDDDTRTWLGTSDDIQGLFLAAPTLAELLHEASQIAPLLMRLNRQPNPKGACRG